MTFSLLGRCVRTGQLGAVVTTSSPCVGARVPFLLAGTGGVLTQHRTDPRLGPRGLALMESGCSAPEALAGLVASTPDDAWRQIAVLDANGVGSHFSGSSNKPIVAAAQGADCVAIGNILANDSIAQAMVDAFCAALVLPLAERLLLAVEAGEAAGGEGRALRSVALKVVAEETFPLVDLRIDASDTPLPALRALWDEFAPMSDLFLSRALNPATL